MLRWLRLVVVFYTLSLTGCSAGSVLGFFFGANNSDDAYGPQKRVSSYDEGTSPADPVKYRPWDNP